MGTYFKYIDFVCLYGLDIWCWDDEAERCNRVAFISQGKILAVDLISGLNHILISVWHIGTDFIQTFELTKKFGDLIAVNSVSLKIESGEIFGLLGPNGAGSVSYTHLTLPTILRV